MREAAINAGIDLGERHVGSRQGLGPAQVSRQDLIRQMLERGVKPEDIPKLARPQKNPEVGQGLLVPPESTAQSAAPIRPPSNRWTPDIGSIPGEPSLYLDVKGDDIDTAKAAIREIESARAPGRSTWQLTGRHGEVLGNYSTPEEAAHAAERHYPEGAAHEVVKPKGLTEGSKGKKT